MTGEDKHINILMCGNRGIFDGMLLTTLSIVKHSSRPIRLFIGTMDLTDLDPRFLGVGDDEIATLDSLLKERCPESSAEIIDFGENFRRELINSKNLGTDYTPYAMIRLFADEAEVLPDKIIYLDTDVLCCTDIGELYDIDVSEYELAGVRDYYGSFFIGRNYLNSGVLLLNLKMIRETGLFRKACKLCNDKKMLLMDQSAINKYLKKRLILPREYNEQHTRTEKTKYQHFSMRIRWFPFFKTVKIKPWDFDLVHDKLGLFCYDDIFESFMKIKLRL